MDSLLLRVVLHIVFEHDLLTVESGKNPHLLKSGIVMNTGAFPRSWAGRRPCGNSPETHSAASTLFTSLRGSFTSGVSTRNRTRTVTASIGVCTS